MSFRIRLFHWRGIDGTEILTHFPPENTYNSELDTQFLLPAQKGFKEKDKLDEFISFLGLEMEEEVQSLKILS